MHTESDQWRRFRERREPLPRGRSRPAARPGGAPILDHVMCAIIVPAPDAGRSLTPHSATWDGRTSNGECLMPCARCRMPCIEVSTASAVRPIPGDGAANDAGAAAEGTAADVAGLLRLFDMATVDDDTFTAVPPFIGRGRIFGGQVAGQSLWAACRTVPPGRAPHSLHAYFIRPGRPEEPLRLKVGRTRDGASFCTRHVTAAQGGKPIFEMIASFHSPEAGHDWQPPMPAEPPGPDESTLPAPESSIKHVRHFDIRPATGPDRDGRTPRHPFWVRLREPIGDDPALHACVLAYISDMGVVTSARAPGSGRDFQTAVSLDHALWFHRRARVDRWLLCSVEPVSNAAARGLATGAFRTAGGTLVASVAQEALLRPHPP